jgi:hypothetical protein
MGILLGGGRCGAVEDVHEGGVLAVDAGGELLHRDHAVHHAPGAGADQHPSPVTRAAVRRHARARRGRAVAVVTTTAPLHLHAGRRQAQLQITLCATPCTAPSGAAVVAVPAHGSPHTAHTGKIKIQEPSDRTTFGKSNKTRSMQLSKRKNTNKCKMAYLNVENREKEALCTFVGLCSIWRGCPGRLIYRERS